MEKGRLRNSLVTSEAKKFSEIKRQQHGTGGGAPAADASPAKERVMKMFEGTPLFTGLGRVE